MLQKFINALFKNLFKTLEENNSVLSSSVTKLSEQVISNSQEIKQYIVPELKNHNSIIERIILDILSVDQKLNQHIANLRGVIDNANLDSIREIADRISEDARELQSLRSNIQQNHDYLNSKIEKFAPAELMHMSDEEWDQYISKIIEEEYKKVKN